jgi:urea transport system permease protein
VVIGKADGNQLALSDAVTGKDAGTRAEADLERVRVNNRLRGTIEAAVGSLTLMSPDPRCGARPPIAVQAARHHARCRPSRRRWPPRRDQGIKRAMLEARASLILASDAPTKDKLEALNLVRGPRRPRRHERAAGHGHAVDRCRGQGRRRPPPSTRCASRSPPGRRRRTSGTASRSGSVLLLAAIGLAITFGTMGVITWRTARW